jgi:hypothetical protein
MDENIGSLLHTCNASKNLRPGLIAFLLVLLVMGLMSSQEPLEIQFSVRIIFVIKGHVDQMSHPSE